MSLRDPIEAYDEDDNPVYCRGCEGHLGQRNELTNDTARHWNGWDWCLDCYHNLEPVIQELERASKADIARDDFIDQVRR